MDKYLQGKAYEIHDCGDNSYKHIYYIPYSEAQNVMRYFRKKGIELHHRYSWNYDTLIAYL